MESLISTLYLVRAAINIDCLVVNDSPYNSHKIELIT